MRLARKSCCKNVPEMIQKGCEVCLERRIDDLIKWRGPGGRTALHMAVGEGSYLYAERLIKKSESLGPDDRLAGK